jgi:signal transduction histidine kinase
MQQDRHCPEQSCQECASPLPMKGGQVFIRGEQQPDYVQVSVQDNGVGIPASDLPHASLTVFIRSNPISRANTAAWDLGLSVAKVMVEMHGGRIWAESNEGVGSTFTFLCPSTLSKTETRKLKKPLQSRNPRQID